MEKEIKHYDMFMIGAGIMSVTLATLLREFSPNFKLGLVERGGLKPMESSESFNNAGTGHSGFCELNYDIEKAINVCESFEQSKQFWAYIAKQGHLKPGFIHSVPHISFVEGQENVDALKKRFLELRKNILFSDMEYTEFESILNIWMPLVMQGRDPEIPVAATRMNRGTDVDFGELTYELGVWARKRGADFFINSEVVDIKKEDGLWIVSIKNLETKEEYKISTKFLFIGAGGATLSLLQKSGIPEADGYGGFPVSGQFLICDNQEVVAKHNAKVYGKPSVGSPPMSVPHLDTRIIDGKKVLLFGPYAGFTTMFLKNGHWTDFFKSLRFKNIFVIISAGLRSLGLSKYLLTEVTKTKKARFKTLLSYYPDANINDWELITAGQRVQVIKKDNGVPTIEFGTEMVVSHDKSLAALMGASPGASTSVHIMLELIRKCFIGKISQDVFMRRVKEIVPSYLDTLNDDKDLFDDVESSIKKELEL
jgi:malate dehydrogenase (quinone)